MVSVGYMGKNSGSYELPWTMGLNSFLKRCVYSKTSDDRPESFILIKNIIELI